MLHIHSQSEKVDEKLYMLMKKNHQLLAFHFLAVGHTALTVYVHPMPIHHRLLQYRKTLLSLSQSTTCKEMRVISQCHVYVFYINAF